MDRDVTPEGEKSEYARNIELFDIKLLTPENIEYMLQVVREYFKKTFPVKPEIVDDILNHMTIVDDETFKKALAESNREIADVDVKYGFYDTKNNVGYVNREAHRTSGEIFVTIFHEALHAVSISAGAGFKGDFVLPSNSADIEQKVAVERGLVTLVEGTTHYLALKHVIGNMGFNGTENMLRYKAERSIMSRIWEAFPENALHIAYFETPIEEIRRYFDLMFASDSEASKNELASDSNWTNGKFADFLANIGKATEEAKRLLESEEEDEAAAMKIHNDIMHAVGYFLIYEHRMNNKKFTDAEKDELHEYLEPYLSEL